MYFTMSLIFITDVTGDKMSDSNNSQYPCYPSKIYFLMITPTTSIGLIHTM